jgi:D-glucosaminate-6-phosphate ammonia-lyase
VYGNGVDLNAFRVINASGRMTALGGCTLSCGVLDAMRRAAGSYCEMERLHGWAAERIAELAGAEAARVVASASAGIVLSVAAVIAGTDPLRIRALPDARDVEARIAIQGGHLVDFGAEIAQMIRLGGGCVVAVGSVNRVDRRDLDALLRTRPAGLVFVQSHHAVQKGMLSLEACVDAAHANTVPVIVDAAAESDLERFVRLGADLVVYSGSKDLLGPTGGIVVGRRAFVNAVHAQSHGIGRAMKVSKETIAGIVRALDEHAARDPAARRAEEHRMVMRFVDTLGALPGVTATVVRESLRPEIERAEVRFHGADAGDRAARLVSHLRGWQPPIWTRDHRLTEGIVAFDPRPLSPADADVIDAALRAFGQI